MIFRHLAGSAATATGRFTLSKHRPVIAFAASVMAVSIAGALSPGVIVLGGLGGGQAHRIKFLPGATETSVTGRLRGQHDKMHYLLRVRAGQRMHIWVDSRNLNNPQIDVIFPSGEHMDRDMQGTQFRTDTSQAGDYRIVVYEGMKGDPSAGQFVLHVKVD